MWNIEQVTGRVLSGAIRFSADTKVGGAFCGFIPLE
jgi:hypothetical protein